MYLFREFYLYILDGGNPRCSSAYMDCLCMAPLTLAVMAIRGLFSSLQIQVYVSMDYVCHLFSNGSGGEFVMTLSRSYECMIFGMIE